MHGSANTIGRASKRRKIVADDSDDEFGVDDDMVAAMTQADGMLPIFFSQVSLY